MAKELTRKQEIFVAEYLTDRNATRAYIAAGYAEKNASVCASQLLRNPKIALAVDKETSKRLGKLEITAERVLLEIARLAFFDVRKVFEDDGSLRLLKDMDEDTAAAIAGLEVTELFDGQGDQKHAFGLLKKVKLADKTRNLELLGKHLKLFVDRVETNAGDRLDELMAAIIGEQKKGGKK